MISHLSNTVAVFSHSFQINIADEKVTVKYYGRYSNKVRGLLKKKLEAQEPPPVRSQAEIVCELFYEDLKPGEAMELMMVAADVGRN